MWLNDTYGDCVTAEEAFAKGCSPGVFITDATVLAFATKNNLLNGAELIDVIDLMESSGFPQDGSTYDDGTPTSVDWTNPDTIRSAVAIGPVKTGVAANQLQNIVPDPPQNGWIGTGFVADPNLDHCISTCGYGPLGWLLDQLEVSISPNVNQDAPMFAVFTWDSIGLLDPQSLANICGEMWLRTPTSVIR